MATHFEIFAGFFGKFSKIGGPIGKFFGLTLSIRNLFKLWRSEPKGSLSLAQKIAFSFLYLAHIGALGVALAVFLGYSSISALIATAIVSGCALLKDIAIMSHKSHQHYKLRMHLYFLERKLSRCNFDFNKNKELHNDLKKCIKQIDLLNKQHNQLSRFLTELKAQQDDVQENATELFQVAQLFKQDYLQDETQRELITRHTNTLGKLDIDTEKALENLYEDLISLTSKRNSVRNQEGQEPLELARLNRSIQNIELLLKHCYKILNAEEELAELNSKLAKIGNPSELASQALPSDIQHLQKHYLREQIQQVKSKIQRLRHPRVGDFAVIERSPSFEEYAFGKAFSAKEALIASIEMQLKQIAHDITSQKAELERKKRFISFFRKDPTQKLPEDLTEIFNLIQEIYSVKNKLELAAVDDNKHWMQVRYSTVIAILALASCFVMAWPGSFLVSHLMLALGIASGFSSLWHLSEKSRIEANMEWKKAKQIRKHLEELKEMAQGLHATGVRQKAQQKISELVAGKELQSYKRSHGTSVTLRSQTQVAITDRRRCATLSRRFA